MAAILFVGCIKEEPYECPLVQTGEVTDIGTSGAIFHGKILGLGNRPILDYGFVWNKTGKPTIEDSYIKSFGAASQTAIFEASISSALGKGYTYHVRSFIRDEKSITYGREIEFISLGSEAPRITGFFPETASWGDTITITGEHFNCMKQENVVLFKSCPGTVISSSETEIKVLVPTALALTESNIAIYFLGYFEVSSKAFTLAAPRILSYSPENGTYKTIVEIKGKGFHPSSTIVRFDTTKAEITKATFNSITAVVPFRLPHGEIDLSVNTIVKKQVADKKFKSRSPLITGFSPSTGTFGDEITITGEDFSTVVAENVVKFGNVNATIEQATANILKVIVPNDLTLKNSKLNISVLEQSTSSTDNFILKSPEIISFSPENGNFGDLITITGSGFNPVLSKNIVKFGDANAILVDVSTNQLQVRVPNNYYSKTGKNKINVSIGESNISSTIDFELNLHSINSFTPDYGSRGDTITIIGQNFNPDIKYNKIYIGDALSTIISGTTNCLKICPATGVTHGKHPISVEVAGRKVSSASDYMVYEPWRRVADYPGGPRYVDCMFSNNGKGYAVGGDIHSGYETNQTDVWEYEPVINKWNRKNNFPVPMSTDHVFTTKYGTYVYFKKNIYKYDDINDSWNIVSVMPITRRENVNTSFYEGGKLFFIEYGYKLIWEYDIETNSWTNRGMPIEMSGMRGISIKNHGYLAFGSPYYIEQKKFLWKYNYINNRLEQAADLSIMYAPCSTCCIYMTTVIDMNEKVYFATGKLLGLGPVRDFYEFDPSTNILHKLLDLPEIIYGGNGFSINNKIYLGTGSTSGSFDTMSADFWEYDPLKEKP
jgi:hypothetical protein